MTDTTEHRATTANGNLAALKLPQLKEIAAHLGIKGVSGMRKGDLVATIATAQGGGAARSTRSSSRSDAPERGTKQERAVDGNSAAQSDRAADSSQAHASADNADQPRRSRQARAGREDHGGRDEDHSSRDDRDGRSDKSGRSDRGGRSDRDSGKNGRSDRDGRSDRHNRDDRDSRDDRDNRSDRNGRDDRTQRSDSDDDRDDRKDRSRRGGNDDQDRDGGRRRGRRYRDRNRRGRDRGSDSSEQEIRDDDVLIPIAGVVDVLDSYAFVRTDGYLPSSKDVYVSLSQVRRYGLRRGDMITGSIRQPRDGEQNSGRQKFTPLAKLDTINGLDPDMMKNRPEFTKLTPLYPNQRLRLETESHILTTRVIDLVMPVGKGQRALIVSPPKAGKTSVLQAVANAISTNNPECHLMVVLVDERPEEVTDMQRSVRGEVIASTFDRPPSDHTSIAELSIERAKRLVEMGKDVVVLLDSITRLGRAYNLAAPASGRILSGGVDSTALFPPKRFLGAARNIENGGSLTIFASALVETGSAGDTVIFEEFKGTGNAELKLDRRLADKRLFPAIDVDASSTRKEELLMGPDELAITVRLRRVLAALEPQQALEVVLDKLRKTKTNAEFMMTVAKNMPLQE